MIHPTEEPDKSSPHPRNLDDEAREDVKEETNDEDAVIIDHNHDHRQPLSLLMDTDGKEESPSVSDPESEEFENLMETDDEDKLDTDTGGRGETEDSGPNGEHSDDNPMASSLRTTGTGGSSSDGEGGSSSDEGEGQSAAGSDPRIPFAVPANPDPRPAFSVERRPRENAAMTRDPDGRHPQVSSNNDGQLLSKTTLASASIVVLFAVYLSCSSPSIDCDSWSSSVTGPNRMSFTERVSAVNINADLEGRRQCTIDFGSDFRCTIDMSSSEDASLARLSGAPFDRCSLLTGESQSPNIKPESSHELQVSCQVRSWLGWSDPCQSTITTEPTVCITEPLFCESTYGASSCVQKLLNEDIARQRGIHLENVTFLSKSHNSIRVSSLGAYNVTLQAPFQIDGAGRSLREFEAELSAVIVHDRSGQINQCPPLSVRWSPRLTYGMDLGTTYSCLAILDGHSGSGKVRVLELDRRLGQKEVPTAVYFPPIDSGKPLLFGYEATEMNDSDPSNLIYDMKRFVGRHFSDPEVQNYRGRYAFKIDPAPLDGSSSDPSTERVSVWVPNQNRWFLPEEVLALFIRWAVSQVDDHFAAGHPGSVPPKLLVSVPASFHQGQRKGIRDAVKLASQQLVQTVVEPTAAGVRAKQEHKMGDYRRVQVWDMGGGTFDVSVIECNNRAFCKVLSTSGNTVLGGRDFDELVVQLAIEQFERQHGWKHEDWTEKDLRVLRTSAEGWKTSISVNGQTTVRHKLENSQVSEQVSITLDQLESAAQPLLELAWEAALDSLKMLPNPSQKKSSMMSKIDSKDLVRTVILVGGSTKFPFFQSFVQKKFDDGKLRDKSGSIVNRVSVMTVDHPQLAVVQGTTYVANSLVDVSDVLPLSIGIQICQSVNRKDMSKHRKYEQKNGRWFDCDVMDHILARNTPYHEGAKSSTIKYYCQYQPKDDYVDLVLFEGESDHASENFRLGSVRISGVNERDPHQPCDNVAVQAEIDSNGVIHLLAKYNDDYTQQATGQLSVITEDGSLNEQQIRVKSEQLRMLYLKNREHL